MEQNKPGKQYKSSHNQSVGLPQHVEQLLIKVEGMWAKWVNT